MNDVFKLKERIPELINPLTTAIRDPATNVLVKWSRYPEARVERYLQNGAVIRRPG